MSPEIELPSRAPQGIAARPFQILCLSGGGYRGLYTAALLEKLENEAGKPLSQVFDVIAGTSIGGILALGLGCGLAAKKLRASFEKNADRIFPKWYRIKGRKIFPRFPKGILKARYPKEGLRDTIDEIFGDKTKAKINSGMATQLLITSVDLTSRTARLFRSTDVNCDTSLIDIALATSAAPTYFPEHLVDSAIMVDGGLVANAPDLIAVIEALKGAKLEDIRVLSVGTAGREGANAYREPGSPGLLASAKGIFELTLNAQEEMSIQSVKELLVGRFIRLDETASEKEREEIGLDMTSKTAAKTLQLMADRTWKREFKEHSILFKDMLNRSK